MTLLTGAPQPDFNNLKLEFGQYVHVFEDNDTSNTNKARTTGALISTNACGSQSERLLISIFGDRKTSKSTAVGRIADATRSHKEGA